MPHSVGILFAFVALVSWGFGDFFIQKTARALGSSKALFFIGVTGSIGLLPFVKNDLPFLSGADLLLLGVLYTYSKKQMQKKRQKKCARLHGAISNNSRKQGSILIGPTPRFDLFG